MRRAQWVMGMAGGVGVCEWSLDVVVSKMRSEWTRLPQMGEAGTAGRPCAQDAAGCDQYPTVRRRRRPWRPGEVVYLKITTRHTRAVRSNCNRGFANRMERWSGKAANHRRPYGSIRAPRQGLQPTLSGGSSGDEGGRHKMARTMQDAAGGGGSVNCLPRRSSLHRVICIRLHVAHDLVGRPARRVRAG